MPPLSCHGLNSNTAQIWVCELWHFWDSAIIPVPDQRNRQSDFALLSLSDCCMPVIPLISSCLQTEWQLTSDANNRNTSSPLLNPHLSLCRTPLTRSLPHTVRNGPDAFSTENPSKCQCAYRHSHYHPWTKKDMYRLAHNEYFLSSLSLITVHVCCCHGNRVSSPHISSPGTSTGWWLIPRGAQSSQLRPLRGYVSFPSVRGCALQHW